MKKFFTRFFLIALVLVITNTQAACAKEVIDQQALTIETKNGGPIAFHVELAITQEQQMYGLMNRTSLPEDAGMLFIFNDVAKRAFWMKDTLIPLDMLFISADGTIHHIHHMAKPQDLTNITSEKPVKAILEINGGLSDILGIAEGDKVIHPFFKNQPPE